MGGFATISIATTLFVCDIQVTGKCVCNSSSRIWQEYATWEYFYHQSKWDNGKDRYGHCLCFLLNAGLAAPAHFCEPGKLGTGRFGCSSVQGSQEESSPSAPHLSTIQIHLFLEVISVTKCLFGGGPKMMILVVELFAFGAPGMMYGTSAMHRINSLVLCSDLAQNPISKCRHSHSASCVTFMFFRSICSETVFSFHLGKCVGVTLKLDWSAP